MVQTLEEERAPDASPEPAASPAGAKRSVVGPLLVAVAATLFLAHAWTYIGAPFGDSHDGRNAGVWSAGAQSLLHNGPIDSRLGALSLQNGVYADHPPLLYSETAVVQAVAGTSPAATRAPAWIGSLVALALVYVLLRDRGLAPVAAGLGVLAMTATHMFLSYGTMLDTFVTSVPFGIWLLILWLRVRDGRRMHPALSFCCALAAPLAGWQSFTVAAIVGAWALVMVLRKDPRSRAALPLMAGTLIGALLVVLWLVWALGGDLGVLVHQYGYRSGQGSFTVSTADFLRRQAYWVDLDFGMPLVVLSAVGLIAALAERRLRALAAAALAVTIPYTLAFRDGSFVHVYWDYWFLLLVALGVAAGVDQASRAVVRRGANHVLVPAIALVAVFMFGSVALQTASLETRLGQDAAKVAAQALIPAGQTTVWYTGALGDPQSWLGLQLHRRTERVTRADLPRLAAERPADMVFLGETFCSGGQVKVRYLWATAAEANQRPKAPTACAA